ncbi:hypothetical protein, partial [Vibrio lentus]|uniref:hypothetical protein n=1 Tax=Vibrio lentus TaxID=136468 RepID=UPI001F538123
GDAKKDAVAAAIARAKAKKAQQTESASEAPVENTGDAKKDAVAAATASFLASPDFSTGASEADSVCCVF